MSRSEIPGENDPRSFPRVSGDEPVFTLPPYRGAKFSPRERG